MLRVMPRPISYIILKALFQGFQMRYHLFPNLFEKKVKIEKRKSPLHDRTLATVIHCMYFYYHTYATICPKYSLKVLLVVLQNLGSSNCYFQGGFSNLFNQNRIQGAYGAPCSCFGYAGCLNTRIVIKEQIVIVCSFKMFMAYLMVVSKQLAGLSKNRTDAGPGERI